MYRTWEEIERVFVSGTLDEIQTVAIECRLDKYRNIVQAANSLDVSDKMIRNRLKRWKWPKSRGGPRGVRLPEEMSCGKHGCSKPATQAAYGSLTYHACDEHYPEIQAKVEEE